MIIAKLNQWQQVSDKAGLHIKQGGSLSEP